MAKQFLTTAAVLAFGAIAIWAVWFYQQNLQGVQPAVFGPAGDIAAQVLRGESALTYPPEFELSIFAEGLSGPRVIAFDPAGTMLVSLPRAGKVVALPDTDNNGRADRTVEVAAGLNRPHGLAFSGPPADRLYIAETDGVKAYRYDHERLQATAPEKIADLPGPGGHSTRTLLFMPPAAGNGLLISVGSSCNVCEEDDWRRAKILVTDGKGGDLRTFAAGLRNAVFMTVHPATGEIWATEMGRDYLGDNLPPDEINIIRQGNDYGWPSCYGGNIPDAEFLAAGATAGACRGKTPSLIDIQAHSAPLGLDFFPAAGWPEKYRHNLLVAYHGSWNRTIPTGYKIVIFRFDEGGRLLGRDDFVSGWLQNRETASGRPVDIKITEAGSIFISDDKAGVIYRLALKDKP